MDLELPNPGLRYKPEIVWRDISTITPYLRNSKKHPQSQVDRLASIIAQIGWDQPIVVDGDGVIIKGHCRYLAAQKLKINPVPAIVRTDLSPADIKAARIADNKVAESDWDQELLALEMRDLKMADYDLGLTAFDEKEIVSFLAASEPPPEGKTDPDAIPDKVETRCKLGDLWQLGKHRLLCGDSTKREDVERLMGGEKADMVFTDPPYGVDMVAKNRMLNAGTGQTRLTSPIYGDDLSVDELKPMIEAAFRNIESILAPKSSYYIASPQGGELGLMMMMMQESGIPCRHMIIWVKNAPVFSMGRLDYDYQHEPLLYGWSKKRTHYFAGGGEFQKSVWHIDREPNKLHPTMKPVKIIENAILNSSDKNMCVADLFLGSGSTLIACEKTERRGFGLEISASYCDVILKRWEDFTGLKAELIESAPKTASENDLPPPTDTV